MTRKSIGTVLRTAYTKRYLHDVLPIQFRGIVKLELPELDERLKPFQLSLTTSAKFWPPQGRPGSESGDNSTADNTKIRQKGPAGPRMTQESADTRPA